MNPPIVELIDVSIARQRESLLSHVSLKVSRGSIHAIVGPNGAGKTTLLMALLGQLNFIGRIVAHWERDGRIGYVPQVFVVDPSLPVTVQDFLALTRQQRPVCFGVSATTTTRIAAMLDDVGMHGLARRPLSVLSGGELRRVLFANALDPLPELLILDEPASGLDESGARQLEERLKAIRAHGTTVLMVSHDLEQVRRIADTVTVLDRRIVAEGAPGEALAHAEVLDVLPAGRRR
jgi:zinc transport system ATP-binding protein